MATDTDRLVLELSAEVTKLTKALDKANGDTDRSLRQIEQSAEGSMTRLEKLFGKTDVGEALENVFKRTRFTVFEEGAARVPIFGSALEALGPAGLVGAAGLAAAAEGFEKVKQAAEEVGSLKITADKLGIPVEDLQRWQFIAAQSHVSNDQLDQSFEGLSVTLGKLKSGIRDQRVKPFLDELGISDADIAKCHTAADLMDLLVVKMAKIKDPSERVQIADAFGAEAALPILSKTRDEIQGMTDDFHANAKVISGEQAEAIERQNQALERAHSLMHDQIRSDLLSLAPLVNELGLAWDGAAEHTLGALAVMLKAYGDFQAKAAGLANAKAPQGSGFGGQATAAGENVIGRFNTAVTHPTTSLLDLLGVGGADARWWNIGKPRDLLPEPPPASGEHKPAPSADVGSGERTRAQTERAAKATDDLSKALAEYVTHTSHAAEMQKRIADDRKNGAVISPQQETQLMGAARADDAKAGAGAGRKAAAAAAKAMEADKASDDAISEAKKAEIAAHIKITGDLAAEHALKLQELADERDKKNRQAGQDAAMGKISGAAATTVIGSNDGAYDDGVALENRNYAEEVANQARTYAADLARYQVAHLTAQAEIATTAEAWAAETKAAFSAQQKVDRDEFAGKTVARTHEVGANHLDSKQAAAEIAAYDAQQADETSKSNRDVDLEVLDRKREFADQLLGYTTSTLQSEAAIATTASQRRALELQILQLRQQQARDALEDNILKTHRSPGQADQLRAGLASQQAGETAEFAQQQASPWDRWMQEGVKAGDDVGQALQSGAVRGMDQLNSGIAEAVANGKNMGDMFKSIFRQMEADAISYLLKQSEVGIFGGSGLGGLAGGLFGSAAPQATANAAGTSTGLLGSLIAMLPHFAAGTDDAPGGLSLVGEKGPELVNLPGGAGVTPNNVLNSIGKLDPSKFTAGQTTMNHNITIDLTGANGDQRIREIAHEAATAGTLQAISYSNNRLKGVQRAPTRDLTRY